MKLNLTTNQAADLLLDDEYAGWTYEGAHALVEHLEDLEDDLGSIDFDRVGLRCDFSEYASAAEALEQYSDCESIEDLEDSTTVIHVPGGGVIVAAF